MASLSLRPSVVDFIDSLTVAPGQRLEEIVVGPGSWLGGKAVREVGAAHAAVRVLAIRSADGGDLVTAPSADLVLSPGDLAVILGPVEGVKALS